MRWGPGPVFIYECLANSRRWQTYALRAAGVAGLLCAMATIASSYQATTANSWRGYAALGQSYFIALIGVELALVVLAAPAATAGAICLDRARGTLAHMLMTDLSDPEIVLGKLAARLLPVLGLVACSWPVMAISSLLGGIDPIALTLAFAIIVAVAVFGCTMALTLSVWARKSHEVILATYTVFIAGLLLWPVWNMLMMAGQVGPPPPWTLLANPFYVAFAPYVDPDKLDLWSYLVFFGAALASSTVMIVVAVCRTRPVACRGTVESSKRPRIGLFGRLSQWLPGPSLDRNPVLWRECHRTRPSRWMTAIVALLMGTTGALCITGSIAFWKNGVDFRPGAIWVIVGVCSYVLHVIFGLLMLAAIAPTSMAEERQRGSLDILAATMLSTWAIVIGKWLGTFRLVLIMAIGPGLMALAMATARSKTNLVVIPGMPPDYYAVIPLSARIYGVVVVIATVLAHGALVTSIGLSVAVWVKRQSRAIAVSVGSFILVAVAWPFFLSIIFRGRQHLGRCLAFLSPLAVCNAFPGYLTSRTYGMDVKDMPWCGTFWAVEVFVLAMGLLWLTVRTFDGCFDRIPDRPHRISVRAVVIVILAGMIGAGSLVAAIDNWIEGFRAVGTAPPLGILAYTLAIAIVLVLIAVETAESGGLPSNALAALSPGFDVWKFAIGRWWKSFRLVLLVAIGPAVIALALATAYKPPRYEPQFTKTAAGVNTVTSYVLVTADRPSPSKVRLGQWLMIAAVLIVTILAHGGAAISVGLGFAAVRGRSRHALTAAALIAVLVALVLPASLTVIDQDHLQGRADWSFVTASCSLLAMLAIRGSFSLVDTLLSVLFWDAAAIAFAAGFSWCTIREWQRRLSGMSTAKLSLATGHYNEQPAVEAGVFGD